VRLSRRYRFAASHRLNTDALTPAENAALYGKCNHPFGHGHDYVLDVTVEGPVDESGQVVRREALDLLVQQDVLARVDHLNLNCDVPELRNQVTTTENLARTVAAMLNTNWNLPAHLARVRISETARNTFELEIK
jgi:6-pyruvoyltetrahydropterin/6-carboxytetrahydropterin synthase